MLRADPYSLRSLGGVFLQASSLLRDRANRVQRGAEELLQGPTGWKGDAPQAFRSSCSLWQDDLIKICNTFERAASTLSQLAYRVEHIEQLRQEARQYENACWDLDPQNPQEQHQLQYLRSRARDLYAAAEMESMAADQQAATSFHEMETVEKSLNLLHSPVWQQYEHNLLLAKLRGLSKAERMGYYDSQTDEEVFQQDFGLMGNEELRAQIRAREEKQLQTARDETALVNQVTSMGLDFVPVVGNVKSAVEAVSGKDYITGEQLTKGQRILAAAGILFGGLKFLGKVSRAADKGLSFKRFEAVPKVEVGLESMKKESGFVFEGAKGSDFPKTKTTISPEMESKLLEGQRKVPKNDIIGGHSPTINNANGNFAVEVQSANADGTKNVVFTKQFEDGNLSKLKKSTLFPEAWSVDKIITSIVMVGDTSAISTRLRDGATWHRAIIDGVEIDVIKIGDDVTSAYPTGTVNAPRPSGF